MALLLLLSDQQSLVASHLAINPLILGSGITTRTAISEHRITLIVCAGFYWQFTGTRDTNTKMAFITHQIVNIERCSCAGCIGNIPSDYAVLRLNAGLAPRKKREHKGKR